MKSVKITNLQLLPEDELYEKTIRYWQQIIALTFAVDVNHIPRRKLSLPELLRVIRQLESSISKLEK